MKLKKLSVVSVLIITLLMLFACSNDNGEMHPAIKKYFDKTKNSTLESWESDIKSTVYGTAFLVNVVPGFHLIGVWIDTLVVVSEAKELAMGNGAIIAKSKSCSYLVSPEDYYFIQGLWVGAVSNSQLQSAFKSAQAAQMLSKQGAKLGERMAARLAAEELMKVLNKKIGLKVTSKVFTKYVVKLIAKKAVGFVPILGAIAAVLINKFWFLDPIDKASEAYFQIKASFICDQTST